MLMFLGRRHSKDGFQEFERPVLRGLTPLAEDECTHGQTNLGGVMLADGTSLNGTDALMATTFHALNASIYLLCLFKLPFI